MTSYPYENNPDGTLYAYHLNIMGGHVINICSNSIAEIPVVVQNLICQKLLQYKQTSLYTDNSSFIVISVL